jgi:hypothetical protein
MSEAEIKPLNWVPDPTVGYSVVRRPDGGMHYIFTDATDRTLTHWREFALQHLYDSDRLTRNLYDLRQIKTIPQEAIQFAVEANSDPAARNIRVAVLVANSLVKRAIEEIAALSAPGGVELGIFDDEAKAEEWLSRPLTTMV